MYELPESTTDQEDCRAKTQATQQHSGPPEHSRSSIFGGSFAASGPVSEFMLDSSWLRTSSSESSLHVSDRGELISVTVSLMSLVVSSLSIVQAMFRLCLLAMNLLVFNAESGLSALQPSMNSMQLLASDVP